MPQDASGKPIVPKPVQEAMEAGKDAFYLVNCGDCGAPYRKHMQGNKPVMRATCSCGDTPADENPRLVDRVLAGLGLQWTETK